MKDYTHVEPKKCDETGQGAITDLKVTINRAISMVDGYNGAGARELAIAKTHLETAAMFATKGFVLAYEVYDERT